MMTHDNLYIKKKPPRPTLLCTPHKEKKLLPILVMMFGLTIIVRNYGCGGKKANIF
jgi:hypothetical protein